MLKRLFKLTLTPKRYLPVVQSRFFTVVDSKSDVSRHSDDIVDDIEQFSNKISISDKFPASKSVIPLLVNNLNCTDKVAQKLVDEYEENIKLLTLTELTYQLKMFLDNGFEKEVLLKYPEVIVMNPSMAKLKLDILKQLPVGENGNNITDYLPLMKLSAVHLVKVRKWLTNEAIRVPKGSRIHYLSEKLSVEPYIIAAVFTNYPFLFRMALGLLYSNTEILLEYKVPTTNILRDPWVFRYSPRQTRKRLSKAQQVRDDKLMPWMARCPDTRLDISLQLTSDIKATLKEMDSEDVLGYLSKRLGYERSEMELYMNRFPPALKVRVTKIKKILDFLLNEAGHTPVQVAAVPRVLCFGLKQMKERHAELESLKYNICSLIVYCFTRSKFSEFAERVRRHRHYLKRDKKKSDVTTE